MRNAACGPEEQAGSSGGLGDFDVADLGSNSGLRAVAGDAALRLADRRVERRSHRKRSCLWRRRSASAALSRPASSRRRSRTLKTRIIPLSQYLDPEPIPERAPAVEQLQRRGAAGEACPARRSAKLRTGMG